PTPSLRPAGPAAPEPPPPRPGRNHVSPLDAQRGLVRGGWLAVGRGRSVATFRTSGWFLTVPLRHIGDALARSRGRRADRASAPEQVGHWWRPLLRRLGEVMTDPWKLDPSGPLPIAPPEYNQRARTQASAVLP